jgi:hypothetical protein
MAPEKTPAVDRFWPKVAKTEDCWVWLGAADPTAGYGNFWDGERVVKAHRWSYEAAYGAIPDGLHLDHLCRNRICVRPDHLEPVTLLENLQRGDNSHRGRWQRERTHCPAGHEYSDTNTWINPKNGARYCRTCNRQRMHARRAAGSR